MRKTIYQVVCLLFLLFTGRLDGQSFVCSTNADHTLTITAYTGSGGVITIPTNVNGMTVSAIGKEAFLFNTNITSVTILPGITNFGSDAFNQCSALTNVTFASGCTAAGDDMFVDCDSLVNVDLPNGFADLGTATFAGCSGLQTITLPLSVKSIGEGVFNGTGFTNLTIPDAITNIGLGAFTYCENLTNISLGKGVANISGAFAGSAISSIVIPTNVSVIGALTFEECASLTNFVIMGALTSVGDYAFSQCGFNNFTIPKSVTNIGNSVFAECLDLTNLVIPSGFADMGSDVFAQCSNLASITFSNGIIGNSMFEDCTSLKNLVISPNITAIGSNAFRGSGLTNLSILGPAAIGNYAFFGTPLVKVNLEAGSVGQYSFWPCTNLTQLTLGSGVTSIGEVAFYGDPITSIVIPGSVTNIGDDAFSSCMLTNIVLSLGIQIIGDYAFYENPITNLYVPSTVTSIGDQAFFGCEQLTSVIIGSGVTSMVTGTFEICSDLRNALFLGNAPAVIGNQDGPVFYYSTNVTVYYLPGTTGWGSTYGAAEGYAGAPTALWNPVLQTGDGGFGVSNGQFGFNITGTVGDPVMVMACTNLAHPQWTPVQSLTLTNGIAHFSDPAWTNAPARYYGLSFP